MNGAERLGVVGSGTIAVGIAVAASSQGQVTLWARSDASAERATKMVAKVLSKIDPERDPGIVKVVVGFDGVGDHSFVLEAVAEEYDVKQQVFDGVAPLLADDAVLGSTTSSLSVTKLADMSGVAERFVGFHVFNPVPRMQLVELVFPDAATEDTRERSRALCALLEKTGVDVPDTPGFVVNRLLFPYLFDAAGFAQQTGMPAADVDACMTMGAGLPMGPLALLDYVGLDVSTAIGESLGVEIPDNVRSLVAEGALGRKSGRGFYDYSKR